MKPLLLTIIVIGLMASEASAQGFFARRANVRAAATTARAANRTAVAINRNVRAASRGRAVAVVAAPVVGVTNFQPFVAARVVAVPQPVVFRTHSLGVISSIPVRQLVIPPVTTQSIQVHSNGGVTINTQGFYR